MKRTLPSKDGEALYKICERTTTGNTEATYATLNTPRWYAVYTSHRHEKCVSEMLTGRGVETFLPLYRTARRWQKSCPMVLELPLFPTYIFVRITHGTRAAVLGVPGVLSIVGSARKPWPLPDFEIEALRSGMHLRKVEPHPYLVVGERARIAAGPMAGMEGVLVCKKSSLRVVLTLDMIMQSVAVEVDAADLEPAGPERMRRGCSITN